jgi:hypothetical protein
MGRLRTFSGSALVAVVVAVALSAGCSGSPSNAPTNFPLDASTNDARSANDAASATGTSTAEAGAEAGAETGAAGPTCTDGVKDGSETDVDCGGGTCSGCAVGKACAANGDCTSGGGCDVMTKTCDANQCHDGIKDGSETDVDCGGGMCPACVVGKACGSMSDCATGAGCDVTTKTCDATQCRDGVKDGAETDIDCGGSTCAGCPVGDACIATSDCANMEGCDATTKTCDANQCKDGVKDGTETDVDCGGSTCGGCAVGKRCSATSDCLSGEGCDVNTKSCDANQCSDGAKDGSETDVDCGGGVCPGCIVGKACNATSDCVSGAGCDSSTKTCDSTQCHDGVKDGSETDVDCGGGVCPGCGVGKSCTATSDCGGTEGCDVTLKTCDANQCNDGLEDGSESDVDCGGPTCGGCSVNHKCNGTSDCISGEGCDKNTAHCDSNTCSDGQKDGSETDVDCGGGTCGGCAVGLKCNANSDCAGSEGCDTTTKTCDANQCHDGVQDGSETDVDCGGNTCTGCKVGGKCNATSDCSSSEGCDTTTKTCDANECHDGVQDGTETDVDCGGSTCSTCAVGTKCLLTSDCTSPEGCDVTTKRCDANACNDGVKDGTETDVDCGGGTCGACAVGKKCSSTSDCLTGEGCDVTSKTCDANACNDGVKNGSETDIDCGGGTCNTCAVGKACVATSDCKSPEGCDVTTKRCDANKCNDGVKDGSETDVDCGGGTCSTCALGENCVANSDCATGNCHVGVCAPACLNTTYSAIGSMQQVTLPSTGNYTLEVTGAQGAQGALGGSGGLGALMQGNFPLTAGNVLQLVVGARPGGPVSGQDGGGGGGGSFVYVGSSAFPLPAAPLLVAGGGGGGAGAGGLITAGTGNGGAAGNNGGSSGGAGGGGVGWLGGGGSDGGVGGGQWNGGAGISASGNNGGAGGFGGGGGAGVFNTGVSGGGGGYSGGNGGNAGGSWGGGGGSYMGTSAISGTTTLTPATQSGSGFVKIVGPLSGTCP